MNDFVEGFESTTEKKDFSGNYMENFKNKSPEDHYPGAILSREEKKPGQYIFYGAETWLELTVVSPEIIKFRYANDLNFEDDFSYAIDPQMDLPSIDVELSEDDQVYRLKTAKVVCLLEKATFRTIITDLEGNVIVEDEKGYHWKEETKYGGNVVIATKKIQKGEEFFGLGDKSSALNLKGRRFELWGTDCYGYTDETDPVYKNIPFYTGLHRGVAYGIFMDNSFRSFFDFGKERQDVTSFWAQGGEMRYYFIYGPEVINVTRRYATLTGRPKMPPLWALGYHQSKWSYYPEQTVRALATKFRQLQIPCDVIHLDIDYMDGYRCFTWDKERFPDPAKLMADLKELGFKTVVILDPGIKIDPNYFVYQQGIKYKYFCTRADGANAKGTVWPGPCYFPDFTNEKVREWWSSLFFDLVDAGVDGFWNDMNEPAVFETGTFPLDVRHDYDGHSCSHRKGHNVYGMQMARATMMGQERFNGNKRSFTITRSGYSGVQRFASVWTGDNLATWQHLSIANRQCQRLSASGISFAGSDVGGFIGTPDAELYTRWIQLAVFHPFFRTHSSGDHGDKEPWIYSETYTRIIRNFIEFRYRLLPYLYSAFWQNHHDGTPMLRSLYMEAQADPQTYHREDEFIAGDHILVCPVTRQGITERLVYLPKGRWYNFWSGEMYEGGREHLISALLNELPLFIRAGAVLPLQPAMQYVGETKVSHLDLYIYPGNEPTQSLLYEDDGESRDYEKGAKKLRTFKTFSDATGFTLEQSTDGWYNPTYQSFTLVLNGFGKQISIEVDGVNRSEELIEQPGKKLLSVPVDFQKIIIR